MKLWRFEQRWADVAARALVPRGAVGGVIDDLDAGALLAEDVATTPWYAAFLLRLAVWLMWLAPLLRLPPRTFGGLSAAEREATLERLLKARAYVVRSAVGYFKLITLSVLLGDRRALVRIGAYKLGEPGSAP
jgi:hypothetical protein